MIKNNENKNPTLEKEWDFFLSISFTKKLIFVP